MFILLGLLATPSVVIFTSSTLSPRHCLPPLIHPRKGDGHDVMGNPKGENRTKESRKAQDAIRVKYRAPLLNSHTVIKSDNYDDFTTVWKMLMI